MALFVFSNLRENKFGLTKAWLARLRVFDEAGWVTHVATIHPQPEIDETLARWRENGLLPSRTQVHHYQRRNRRFRPSWSRRTDDQFTRDDRIADWLDWLVGRIPGVVVFADSPVTYAPVAKMTNPFVGRVMTLHLVHRHRKRKRPAHDPEGTPIPVVQGAGGGYQRRRSRYGSVEGRPKLADRFLPYGARADVVVALTEGHARHLRSDLPGVEVRTIPNMVQVPELPEGLVRDPLRVVYLGRLEPLKRVDHAIRAAGLAAQSLPGLRFDVYGRGADAERLVELRDALGLAGVVEIHDFTQAPEQELATAALSTMTAKREPFGLSVAESLAVGTPVLTYDVDYGPRELVADGITGRVVAAGDIEALARAMTDTLADQQAWASMSAAGPAAIGRLHPSVVGRMWLDLAEEVAGRIARPDDALLVEDLRVRRAGLQVQGVAFGAAGPGGVRSLGLGGSPGVPFQVLEAAAEAGPLSGSHEGLVGPNGVADVTALLSWATVASWPVGVPLTAVLPDGSPGRVIGPGIPTTVAPTEEGPILIGWDEDSGTIERIAGPTSVPVTARLTSVRASVGDDVTVLSELQLLQARVTQSLGQATWVSVRGMPGLEFTPESVLAVAAGSGDRTARVGHLRFTGAAPSASGTDAGMSCVIDWDVEGLAELATFGTRAAPLRLAVGRSLRTVGTVDLASRRALPLAVLGDRWALVRSTSGRAMLVRGGTLRVGLAQASRNFRATIGRGD